MTEIVERVLCCGCGACASVCPAGTIHMEADREGFLRPVIGTSCVDCGECQRVCPARENAAEPRDAGGFRAAYAAVCKDDGVRGAASSGGVFPVLAQFTLQSGGAVFGARLDENQMLRHATVENARELPELFKSKYVQSDTSCVYGPIQSYLDRGIPVLFCGTPCQTAAVFKRFGEHDSLFRVAVACHGVPSPKVFSKYIAELETAFRSRVQKIDFKDKTSGWRTASVRATFADGRVSARSYAEDSYMQAFLQDLSIRPSCAQCFAKGVAAHADLMIADFWGVEKILPEMDDNKGTSLVLVCSQKGERAMDLLRREMKVCEADAASALAYNPYVLRSAPSREGRAAFFAELETLSLAELMEKYGASPSLGGRLKGLLRRLKNK